MLRSDFGSVLMSGAQKNGALELVGEIRFDIEKVFIEAKIYDALCMVELSGFCTTLYTIKYHAQRWWLKSRV